MNKAKKITANTVALKTCVPGEGTQDSRQIFFSEKKGIELLTALASFSIPLFH